MLRKRRNSDRFQGMTKAGGVLLSFEHPEKVRELARLLGKDDAGDLIGTSLTVLDWLARRLSEGKDILAISSSLSSGLDADRLVIPIQRDEDASSG